MSCCCKRPDSCEARRSRAWSCLGLIYTISIGIDLAHVSNKICTEVCILQREVLFHFNRKCTNSTTHFAVSFFQPCCVFGTPATVEGKNRERSFMQCFFIKNGAVMKEIVGRECLCSILSSHTCTYTLQRIYCRENVLQYNIIT